MALAKPLVPEEVPEEYRDSVYYKSAFQQSYTYAGRTKMRSMVYIKCPVCEEYKATPVNDVRNYIKGIRSQFPNTHRKCKYLGRYQHSEGYIFIWEPTHPNCVDGKYVAEHIKVMSDSLGRAINTKNESVHHIDGDRTNNDISNLQLRKRYHGKGQKWECADCGSHNILAIEI